MIIIIRTWNKAMRNDILFYSLQMENSDDLAREYSCTNNLCTKRNLKLLYRNE